MNTQDLRDRITIQWKGYGTYRVTIEYRGKLYFCTSHNSLAYDRINNNDIFDNRVSSYGYTYREALSALYNECKRANGL